LLFTNKPPIQFKKRSFPSKASSLPKANVGDIIQFSRDGQTYKGKVLVVRDNSVIVKFGINPKTKEPLKTVVNHKNYIF